MGVPLAKEIDVWKRNSSAGWNTLNFVIGGAGNAVAQQEEGV